MLHKVVGGGEEEREENSLQRGETPLLCFFVKIVCNVNPLKNLGFWYSCKASTFRASWKSIKDFAKKQSYNAEIVLPIKL